MSPARIVEAVDVSAKGKFGVGACLKDRSPNQLVLDRLEHGLDYRIEAPIFVKPRFSYNCKAAIWIGFGTQSWL